MVEYEDGSVLAQLGNPDMRTPIAHALSWPLRMKSGVAPLDLFEVGRLDFRPPDLARFPCLRLAYEALAQGGTSAAVLNAANEEAVQAFLEGQIRYTEIAVVSEYALERVTAQDAASLEIVLESDLEARRVARERLRGLAVEA
jgi:1-deoxy-D-xylulose-5-phosphate reductoisomerase